MKITYSVWVVFPDAVNADRMLAALHRYGYKFESLDNNHGMSWTSEDGQVVLALEVVSGKDSPDSLINSLDRVMDCNGIKHIFRLAAPGDGARWNVGGVYPADSMDVPESGLLVQPADDSQESTPPKVWLN